MKGEFEHRLKNAVYAVTGLLLVLAVWGGGRLLFLSEPEPVAPAAASLQVDAVNYPESSVEANDEIVERPLFWQGRRPPESKVLIEVVDDNADAAADAGKELDKIKLLGVYGGDTPGVIILYEGKQQRVALNESIAGWTLLDVIPDGAMFNGEQGFKVLDLKHADGSQQGAGGKAKPRRKLTKKK
jgi:hypothetical protein